VIRFFALVSMALGLIAAWPAVGQAVESHTVISGGDLPRPITIAPADEDAFYRRITVPPKLDNAPEAAGPSYTITSPYWPQVLPGNKKDRPPAAEEATYYPEGGFVKARQGEADSWLVLDQRQRAILDRYIRLGRRDLLPSAPSALQVVGVSALVGEPTGVLIGTRVLTADERARFWEVVSKVEPESFDRLSIADRDFLRGLTSQEAAAAPGGSPDSAWVSVDLAEGRSLRLFFDAPRSRLVEFVGEQVYQLPQGFMASLLGGSGAAAGTAPAPMPQDEPVGSQLWWPVMVLGGLAALGVAAWLARGQRPGRGGQDAGQNVAP
jgi:hypothetical protein